MENKVQVLRTRHRILLELRKFFDSRGFIEIQTPLLVPNPGLEPHLIPFETELQKGMGISRGRTLYLPTSPEYHLKKALSWGLDRVFEVTRGFRNGELGPEHEPEFMILEWYRNPGTYMDIANDFKEMMARFGEYWAPSEPWNRPQDLTVRDAFKTFCEIDLDLALEGKRPLTQQARAAGHASVLESDDFDTAFNKLIVEKIEPQLGRNGPQFLWDYPASQAALARKKPENPLYCERFEVYWKGVELANAFGELTDSVEQRERCLADQATRRALYGKTPPLDEEFLSALAHLAPEVGGIAVGLDRFIQCLLGLPRLQDAIGFPKSAH